MERIGIFLCHNNILIGVLHDPGTLRIGYGAGRFQSLRERESIGGLALHNSQIPAVLVVLSGCVVAREKPLCALAPVCYCFVLSFSCYHAVCWISKGNFWGTPDNRMSLFNMHRIRVADSAPPASPETAAKTATAKARSTAAS